MMFMRSSTKILNFILIWQKAWPSGTFFCLYWLNLQEVLFSELQVPMMCYFRTNNPTGLLHRNSCLFGFDKKHGHNGQFLFLIGGNLKMICNLDFIAQMMFLKSVYKFLDLILILHKMATIGSSCF